MKPDVHQNQSPPPSLQSLQSPKVPAYPPREIAAFFKTCLTTGLALSWIGESDKCHVHFSENDRILLRTQPMDEATCALAWEMWDALASSSSLHTSAEELLVQLIENESFMNSISPQERADLVTAGEPPRAECPALEILMLSPHLITNDTADQIITMASKHPASAFAVRLPDSPFFVSVDGKEHWDRLVREVSALPNDCWTIAASLKRRLRNAETLAKELGEVSTELMDDTASTVALVRSKTKKKSTGKAQDSKEPSTGTPQGLPKSSLEDPIINAIINDTLITPRELATWQEKRIHFRFPEHQRHATQLIQALSAPKWRSVEWVSRFGRDTACQLVNTDTVVDLVALGLTTQGDSSLLVGVAQNLALFSELLKVDPAYVAELWRRVFSDSKPNRFVSIVRERMNHSDFDLRYGARIHGVAPKEIRGGISIKSDKTLASSGSDAQLLRDGRIVKTALEILGLFDKASPESLATVSLPDAISLGYFVKKLTSPLPHSESRDSDELARRRFFAGTNRDIAPTRKAAAYLARHAIANPIAPETVGLINNPAFKAKLIEGLRHASIPELIRTAGRSQAELEELAALPPNPSYSEFGVNENFLRFLTTVKGGSRLHLKGWAKQDTHADEDQKPTAPDEVY